MCNIEECIDTEYAEIRISCCSEKEDASVGFGCPLESEEIIFEDEYVFLMQEGLWENYHEFEDGIKKVKELLKSNNELTIRQAIFEVFGHFCIVVEIDGVQIEPQPSLVDAIESCIYSLLEPMCDL